MTTPTVDRERLQAALAALNLSLESELTQFRCHRLVQSHRPLETPEPNATVLPLIDFPKATAAPAPTESVADPVASPPPLSLVATSTPASSTTEELGDFDPAELLGLLPQSYAANEPEPVATSPSPAPKRPFASTRELLKQARQNNQPWFQRRQRNSQHHVQRWLIIMGILAGLGGGILFWLTREQPLPELVTETETPVEPTETAVPPSGPNMAAREFPDVNRSTLAQLEPADSPEPSPVSSAAPESDSPDVFVEQAANGRYYVLAPYKEPADLAKVQEVVPEAFLVGSGDDTKIQLGMFEDEPSAQAMADQLRDRL